MKATIIALFASLSLIACKDINQAYQGEFTSENGLHLLVAGNKITLISDGAKEEFTAFFNGFSEVTSALEAGKNGIYTLPSLEATLQFPSANPFLVRMPEQQELEIGYRHSADWQDVFLVSHLQAEPTVNAHVFDATADVLYFKLQQSPVGPVDMIQGMFVKDAELTTLEISEKSIRQMGIRAGARQNLIFTRGSQARDVIRQARL